MISATKEGYELVHWMGPGKSQDMWRSTAIRDGDSSMDSIANMQRRKGKINKWKDLIKEEEKPRRMSMYSREQASQMLVAFQKGSMRRQGMTLICHITGISVTLSEIQRSTETREKLMKEALANAGVDESVIKFTAPEVPIPTFISAEDLDGEAGEKYRSQAMKYNQEAQRNYRETMQTIMDWAEKNLPGGALDVNKAVQSAMTRIRKMSADKALDVPSVPLDFPSDEERKKMFQEIDGNGNGKLSLAELDLAVKRKWPQFDHKQAIIRAYKLADKDRNGFLTRNDDIRRCEFSRFLKYLELYVKYWHRFNEMDTDKSRSVDMGEWVRNAPRVLDLDEGELSLEELQQIFREIDIDNGGRILFDEFCMFAAKVFGDEELTSKNALVQRRWMPSQSKTWREAATAASWRQSHGRRQSVVAT